MWKKSKNAEQRVKALNNLYEDGPTWNNLEKVWQRETMCNNMEQRSLKNHSRETLFVKTKLNSFNLIMLNLNITVEYAGVQAGRV